MPVSDRAEIHGLESQDSQRMKTVAAQVAPPLVNNKRHRDAYGETPKKRLRSSLEEDSQARYTIASDIFGLQVQELLGNLEAETNTNLRMVTGLLTQVKEAIEDLPSQKPLLAKEADALLRSTANVVAPFPVPLPKDAQYTLEFAKPSAINVVGSAASNTLLRRNGEIIPDMVVVMPTQIFQEKDYRKYRYFHKKAFYTAYIVAGLQRSNTRNLSYVFSVQNGNPLQPCILVRYQESRLPHNGTDISMETKDGHPSVVARIMCLAPNNIFPQDKLLPWINNCPQDSIPTDPNQRLVSSSSFYNSTLRSEMLSLTYLGLIHKVNKDVPSLRKASLLFSVWLRQRGLGSELFQGGFGSFEAQALMAIMLNGDPENGIEAMFRTRYDHHQLFKATLILLVSRDFVKNPALYNFPMNGSVGQSNSQPLQSTREDIIDNAAALFFDGPRAHNILFKMSPWAYANLRRHAKITIHALNGTDQSRFEHCFISKLDNALTQYDQVMDVNLAELSMWSKAGTGTLDRTFNISNVLYQTLKRALTDRVQHIAFQCERTGDWETKIDRPKSKKSLQLNFIVDARQATRVQDLGPPAESKEAAASFRQFWGPKAELRRFRDGNIQETIVWNDGGVESIVTQIVRHTLSQHHGDGKAISIKEIGASFWTQLPQSKQSHTLTTFEEIQRTYHNLEQIIRGLKMPLTIRQISAASSGLRYSLLNIDSSLIHQPLYIVVQFESSGQWPDDLGAIQQVKIAFLQKLADLITQHTPAIRTRVGLNHQANNLFFRPFLEVLIGDFCFHILLYHDRELILLRSRPVNSLEERKLVVPEIHYHNTMLVRVPAHTSKIRDLCTQYPLLSQSIRLFKAWCSTHLLTSHFREELLEIFVVSTFTESAPCGVPSSLRTAFLRTISMLAKWDWRNEPLFVTMSEETDQGLIGQLNAHFEVWRKLDPSLSRIALIVGSTLDPTGTAWTEQGPSKMIAARLSALAKAAHSTIMKTDLKLNAISLFTHPTSDYDFVIHLNTKQRKFEGIDFSAMVKEYVEDLKRAFGDTLVWFHSGSSQKLIAGLWNPTVESKRWKVNLGYSTVPLSNDHSKDDGTERVEVRTNLEAILNEITRLGGDLVIGVILKNGKPYTDLDTNHSTKKLPAGGK